MTFASSIIGVGICLATAITLQGSRVLRQLGAASLAFHLLHTFVSAGARIMFDSLYSTSPPLILLFLITTAGLTFPLVFHVLPQRYAVAPYLGLGRISRPTNAGICPARDAEA